MIRRVAKDAALVNIGTPEDIAAFEKT
jgi:hypothetical protein